MEYIITTKVISALHLYRFAKPSSSFRWSKGRKVSTAGRQVTLCDPTWHAIFCNGQVIHTKLLILLIYLTYRDELKMTAWNSTLATDQMISYHAHQTVGTVLARSNKCVGHRRGLTSWSADAESREWKSRHQNVLVGIAGKVFIFDASAFSTPAFSVAPLAVQCHLLVTSVL